MSPIEYRKLIESGAVQHISQQDAAALRADILARNYAAFSDRRHIDHDLISRGVVELTKRACGEGADLPYNGENVG